MIGKAFTEFFDLVEVNFGYAMVDRIIQESKLPNNGAYLGLGMYPYTEMARLLSNLSLRAEVPVKDLLCLFGRHIFGVFVQHYGHFFQGADNTFTFLENIDRHLQSEASKLYPDSGLPRFETHRLTDNTLELIYHSERRIADFAEGLIEATLDHFQETATIFRENITPDSSSVRFLIKKQQV